MLDIIEYDFKIVMCILTRLLFRQNRTDVLYYYVLESCSGLHTPGCLMLFVRPIAAICTVISFLPSTAWVYNVHFVCFKHHKVYQHDVHLVVSVSCS